jgi:hypothetical protein
MKSTEFYLAFLNQINEIFYSFYRVPENENNYYYGKQIRQEADKSTKSLPGRAEYPLQQCGGPLLRFRKYAENQRQREVNNEKYDKEAQQAGEP